MAHIRQKTSIICHIIYEYSTIFKLLNLYDNFGCNKSEAWSTKNLQQFFINHIWSHALASSNSYTKFTCGNRLEP